MSDDRYDSPALVRSLYSDPGRIAARGGFLEAHSNRKHSVRGILRMLLADRPRRAVLDYGCGDGSFLRSILDDPEIREAYALDVVRHDRVSTLARTAYVDALGAGRARVPPVDAIFCMNVLYHVDPSERARILGWMGERLNDGGSLFVTTKSADNFPGFRKVLDDLGLIYPPEADEAAFCVENGRAQGCAALSGRGFSVDEYPLVGQVVTRAFDEVVDYMLSSRRFSGLGPHAEALRGSLAKRPLFVDTYRETIIHATKQFHVE